MRGIVFIVVGYLMLPVYMKLRVTSAYELLEERLGVSIRILGASMFLILRLVWMSLLIYAAAKAFSFIIDVDEKWIPVIVIITGSIALIYASLGGMRAVVITDLMQTVLLYGGAVLVIIVVSVKMGGFSWFPTVSINHGFHCQINPKDQLFLSRSFVGFTIAIHTQRHSINSLIRKEID